MCHKNEKTQDGDKKRNQVNKENVQLVIDVPQKVKETFQDAVERNGKSMEDVLKLYMQKYIWKQSELQRNRQKRRENIG
jgi:galactose-1-phosphate uridylyltransferase